MMENVQIKSIHSLPCDRRSADSLRFVCDPQEQKKKFELGIS